MPPAIYRGHKGGKTMSKITIYNSLDYLDNPDDVEIYDENGHLFIRTTHHDGSNLFEVKALTDAGLNAVEAFTEGRGRWYDLSKKELHLLCCYRCDKSSHI